MQAGYPVALLAEQYRMHPTISDWPSRFFYDRRIVDHAGLKQARHAPATAAPHAAAL